VQPESEPRGDAEVAAAATERPEEVRVVLRVDALLASWARPGKRGCGRVTATTKSPQDDGSDTEE
jgi:hypothetical protein